MGQKIVNAMANRYRHQTTCTACLSGIYCPIAQRLGCLVLAAKAGK